MPADREHTTGRFTRIAPSAQRIAGRYDVVALLGRGGMGSTYLARDRVLRRTVAIKVIRPELLAKPTWHERFRNEALIASRLAHPNIVAVLDFGLDGDSPFLVMELAHGRSLALRLRAGPLLLADVGPIMQQLLSALDEVHAAGVIHGDVKAGNLVIAQRPGKGPTVKLLDFGIARRLDDAPTDEVGGTPEYMAPEVIRGAAPAAQSDLYAAAVVLYEMLTGRPPFTGPTGAAVLGQQLHDAVVLPSLRRPERPLSERLEAVVCQALAKQPEQRFRDARDFAAALDAALEVPVDEAHRTICPACHGWTIAHPRFCPECGVAREGTALGGASGAEEKRWRRTLAGPLPLLPRASRATIRLARWRRAIGEELAAGDLAAAVPLYLALGRRLAAAGQVSSAIAELEEAVDVLTVAEGAAGGRGPAGLWRLLSLLAALYYALGRVDDARATALQARRHAALGH